VREIRAVLYYTYEHRYLLASPRSHTKTRLQRLAKSTGRSRAFLAAEAIEGYLDMSKSPPSRPLYAGRDARQKEPRNAPQIPPLFRLPLVALPRTSKNRPSRIRAAVNRQRRGVRIDCCCELATANHRNFAGAQLARTERASGTAVRRSSAECAPSGSKRGRRESPPADDELAHGCRVLRAVRRPLARGLSMFSAALSDCQFTASRKAGASWDPSAPALRPSARHEPSRARSPYPSAGRGPGILITSWPHSLVTMTPQTRPRLRCSAAAIPSASRRAALSSGKSRPCLSAIHSPPSR
jgi:hypothetical protein